MAELQRVAGKELVAEIEALAEKLAEAKASVNRRFIGQEQVVDLSLAALLCGGHGLAGGSAGPGQDHAGGYAGDRHGPEIQPYPVHA